MLADHRDEEASSERKAKHKNRTGRSPRRKDSSSSGKESSERSQNQRGHAERRTRKVITRRRWSERVRATVSKTRLYLRFSPVASDERRAY